jgi:rRNA-processing protein FCF1
MNRAPFAAIEVLLIDGNNLLHRTAGGADPAALRGLLPRLSAAIPATVSCIVMLDGHAAQGSGRVQRIRPGLEIRHAGSLSADEALLNLVRERVRMTTLVSDDRALRDKAMSLGAHTVRLAWLEELLKAPQPRPGQSRPPSIGNRRR